MLDHVGLGMYLLVSRVISEYLHITPGFNGALGGVVTLNVEGMIDILLFGCIILRVFGWSLHLSLNNASVIVGLKLLIMTKMKILAIIGI